MNWPQPWHNCWTQDLSRQCNSITTMLKSMPAHLQYIPPKLIVFMPSCMSQNLNQLIDVKANGSHVSFPYQLLRLYSSCVLVICNLYVPFDHELSFLKYHQDNIFLFVEHCRSSLYFIPLLLFFCSSMPGALECIPPELLSSWTLNYFKDFSVHFTHTWSWSWVISHSTILFILTHPD